MNDMVSQSSVSRANSPAARDRMITMKTLEKIMNSFECYEKSPYRSNKHNTYFPVYDELFAPYIGKNITFVEIGILNGGSLFMWRDFFGPEARIVGVDLNPQAKKWEAEGFEIFIGSQTDRSFWKEIFSQIGDVDIVLDDGGHKFEQQIITTECVVSHIRDGGLLVVEDTHTSYMKEFGGPSPFSFVSYAKNIVEGVNFRFSEFCVNRAAERTIWSIQFFESIVSFSINRSLAGIISKQTHNDGESLDAIDFRNLDEVVISASDLITAFKY